MKSTVKIISVIILLFLQGTLLQAQPSRVEIKLFYSPKLGISKAYYIYLPAGYDSTTQRYPAVYFFRAGQNEWFDPTPRTNGKMLKDVADSMTAIGLIGKMILVGPSTLGNIVYAPGVNMLRPDLAGDPGIGTGKFEDYLLQDLIHSVDSNYRTIADFNHRGIDGFSLGGYTSTMLSLRNPGVFSSVGSYDGTFMWYNLYDPGAPGPAPNDGTWMTNNEAFFDPIFDQPRNVPYMLLHDAANILFSASPQKLDSIKNIRYHISTGDELTYTNRDRTTQFDRFLRQKNIINSFQNIILAPGAEHLWNFADVHASKTLIRHWQKFSGVKICAPLIIDFNTVEIGTADTSRFLVFNYGPYSLTVNSINSSPSVYNMSFPTQPPYVLTGKYDSAAVKVIFKPTTTTQIEGSVTILSSDTASPNTTVKLFGKGFEINQALGGVLYGVTGTLDSGSLITINTTNGSGITLGKSGFTQLSGLSIKPSANKIYATYSSISTTYLIKVNATTGNSFQYSTIPVSNINAIAFDLNDELYGALDTNGLLFNINPQTGDTALVGPTGINNLRGIAFNPLNRQLWGIDLNGSVYKINKLTGVSNLIGNTGFTNTNYITFNLQGKLYGVSGSASQLSNLISIDTSTGTGTLIGSTDKHGINGIAITANPLIVKNETTQTPGKFALFQNYPNPFNPISKIKYQIAKTQIKNQKVQLVIYNFLGQKIETLVNETQEPGTYEVTFNGSNLASGVYFYRLTAKGFTDVKRMVMIK